MRLEERVGEECGMWFLLWCGYGMFSLDCDCDCERGGMKNSERRNVVSEVRTSTTFPFHAGAHDLISPHRIATAHITPVTLHFTPSLNPTRSKVKLKPKS